MEPLSLSTDNPLTQGIYHHASADLIVDYLATFFNQTFLLSFSEKGQARNRQ